MEGIDAPGGDRLLYLYGFVSAAAPLPRLEGIEPGAAVFLVPSRDLACAASLVDANDYRPDVEGDRPERGTWVTTRAVRHHEVLAALHQAGGVLPLKFGTTCKSEDDVRAMLDEFAATLRDLLAALARRDEWTVRMSADVAAITERLERETPGLRAMCEAEAALPEGRAYFARKQRARAVGEQLARVLGQIEDAVCDRLSAAGLAVARTRRAANGSDRGFPDAAVLVERTGLDAMKATLAALQAEHAAAGLSFTLVGPWPPYSFVTAIDRANCVGN
jgi:hypothetical protein